MRPPFMNKRLLVALLGGKAGWQHHLVVRLNCGYTSSWWLLVPLSEEPSAPCTVRMLCSSGQAFCLVDDPAVMFEVSRLSVGAERDPTVQDLALAADKLRRPDAYTRTLLDHYRLTEKVAEFALALERASHRMGATAHQSI
jgi:hypothetical protein